MSVSLARLAARLIRSLPWWVWTVIALVVIGAADRQWLVGAGIGGAVVVLGLLFRVMRRGGSPALEDWKQAERLAASWLQSIGCRDVELTTAGADGGVDIVTREWAVQVKHRSARVGRPAIQQIVGAALAVDRSPAVVSTSGFTAPAIEFADHHDVALIVLDGTGRGHRVNRAADRLGRRRARFLR